MFILSSVWYKSEVNFDVMTSKNQLQEYLTCLLNVINLHLMIWINLSCALKCAGMLIVCIMFSVSI